ncbi:hypothetical protein [Vibrio sp. TBV020]|uniref:hypothetical protein n=1 Tax=Vibrio sp. TBV020 TaxID=3137398 RepID=UPI0038CD7437
MKYVVATLGLTALLAGCSMNNPPSPNVMSFCETYKSGAAVAVLGSSPVVEGEWYGDWAYNLNQFGASHPTIKIWREEDNLGLELPKYTLLVAQKDTGEYQLREVVEQPYYDYVMAAIGGFPVDGVLSYFQVAKQQPSQISALCR